jgi:hypothetical protein
MKNLIKKVLYEFVEIHNDNDYKPLKSGHPIYSAIESILDSVENPYQVDYTVFEDEDYDVMVEFELDRSHGGLLISKKDKEIIGEIRINILQLYYLALGPNHHGNKDYLRYMSDVSDWHWEDFRDELRDKIINHLPALENIEIKLNPIFQKK